MWPQTRRRRQGWRELITVLAALAIFGSMLASAQPRDTAPDDAEPTRGAVLYRLHCASCHGAEGRGDGPLAADLESAPPDLTRIAARRGGRFSSLEIERIIDGRTEIGSHGGSEMPVWGLSFRQPGRLTDQEEEVWLQVRHLVRHLRSLQVGKVIDET